MTFLTHIYALCLGVFLFIPITQAIINPSSVINAPTSEESMSVVDRTAAQSIALFAIVLVVIQFILDDGIIGYYQTLTIGVLSLCAGFLMLTFILELFGGVKIILFHIQITALRYSGLLLFSGLFFLLLSYPLEHTIQQTFGFFVGLSWLTWIVHEIHYLFYIQRRSWNSRNITRRTWLANLWHKINH